MKSEADTLRVLLVDDNATSVRLMARILADAGVEALALTDAEEAIRRTNAGGYDAIFVDLRMAPVDGLEILRRTRDASTRRYVLTGYADAEEETRALALGAAAVLHKPLDVDEALRLARSA
jgi:CheY-like chemotaxis protein